MTAPVLPGDLEQLQADSRRWRQTCDLLGIDRNTDPIHTLFSPWKATAETEALMRYAPSKNEPISAAFQDMFGDDDAGRYEAQRNLRILAERKVAMLQAELLRLRAQVAAGGARTGELAPPRPKPPDVLEVAAREVGGAGRPVQRRVLYRQLPRAEDE